MSLPLPLSDEPCAEPEIALCPVPKAASQARGYIRRRLTELGFPALVDDGVLVGVELVTNAVREAPEGPVRLSLRLAEDRPVIEVRDCSPILPVLKDADFVSETGRGLHIVDALSAELGWRRVGRGKVVWAALR